MHANLVSRPVSSSPSHGCGRGSGLITRLVADRLLAADHHAIFCDWSRAGRWAGRPCRPCVITPTHHAFVTRGSRCAPAKLIGPARSALPRLATHHQTVVSLFQGRWHDAGAQAPWPSSGADAQSVQQCAIRRDRAAAVARPAQPVCLITSKASSS